MRRQIPNFITLLNLLSGCVAVLYAVVNQLEMAALFVALGIFFDFFDGLAARMLHVESPLGVQLDSLADMVTSGLVPGLVMYQLIVQAADWESFGCVGFQIYPLALIGFAITLGSAYRLAKFNIDESQKDGFIGLPTPANTAWILSLPLILATTGMMWLQNLLTNQWFLIGCSLLSAYIMNANIPLFALKFKEWGWGKNKARYLFVIGALVMIAVLQFVAIPIIIFGYVLLSVLAKEKF